MANSPITALVLREERNSQAVGTSWVHFSFVSSLSYHTWRQWNYWSLFRMVMEKPITSVLKGMSRQGELCGVPFQPQGELCSALGYPGALQSPTSPWGTRGPLDLLFSSPIHPPLFCILALNPETNFIFFSYTSKQNPAFSGNDTLSHTWFLENTNLSAPASVTLVTIFIHKAYFFPSKVLLLWCGL